jgi:hypothetical protein
VSRLILTVILATFVACPALSNPILLTPTGTTLTTGQVRAEAAFSPSNDNGKYYWFATGFRQFEANYIRHETSSGQPENLLGAQWCFIPETFFTPAVAFGVTDIASQSQEGPSGYFAVTKNVPIERLLPAIGEFKATIGFGAGGIRGPFAGFETKLPFGFFAEGEYDTRDFNGAIGWQPTPRFRIKAYTIRADYFLGAELVPMSF